MVKATRWQTHMEQGVDTVVDMRISSDSWGKWQTFNGGHGFYLEKATDRGLLGVRCIWTSSQVLLLTTNVGKVCLCMVFYTFYKDSGVHSFLGESGIASQGLTARKWEIKPLVQILCKI